MKPSDRIREISKDVTQKFYTGDSWTVDAIIQYLDEQYEVQFSLEEALKELTD